MSESGRDAAIYLYGPGSILGLRAITSKDGILRHSAEALTDCEIAWIARDEYLKILSENPEYIVDLMHSFIYRLNNAERKLEGFILTDTTARVASFLLDVAKRFGEKKGTTIVLPLQLTHQRVSEFVGSFRETVTIALNKLIDEKIISVEKGIITILKPKKLEGKTQIHDTLED
jgi:CRP/FNR family transcriptional regulator